MALQQNKQLQNGLIANNAYIRIDTVSGYKGEITISVNSYTSQQAFLDQVPFLVQNFYTFVPDVSDGSLNFIKQGYEYLKTIDEYVDAIDC